MSRLFECLRRLVSAALLILLQLWGSSLCAQENLEEAYSAHIATKRSISYSIDYQIKLISQTRDTTRYRAKVHLVRDSSDKVYGGHVYIEHESKIYYYDTERLTLIDHEARRYTTYNRGNVRALNNLFLEDVIRVPFFRPTGFEGYFEDVVSVERDTLWYESIEGKTPLGFTLKPIFSDIEDEVHWYYFHFDSTATNLIESRYYSEIKKRNQFNRWLLSDVRYDKVSVAGLKERMAQYRSQYRYVDMTEEPKKEYTYLPEGTRIPDITGVDFPDSNSTALSQHMGKFTLVDLWYMNCYPCMQAQPMLNKLDQRFGEKGLAIVGIDGIDLKPTSWEQMPDFVGQYEIGHPLMFVEREVLSPFAVQAYPSFYLLDADRQLIKSWIGYNEDIAAEIDQALQDYLKR